MGVPPPSDEGPFDRTYHRRRRTRKPLLAATAFAITAAYAFLRWRPLRIEVSGPSMRPGLEPGDWALAFAVVRYRRGDVVIVEHPDRPGFEMVKRVVSAPGDVAPDGRQLGRDEFWVEGDVPDASTDSRHFGPVRRDHLKARVRVVYWPLERRRRL